MTRGADADDQDRIISSLASAPFWGVEADAFAICETHIAVVFLAGPSAFKMKKSVDLSYLNFTTLARRHKALTDELRLNRRTAPDLYKRLVPLTRTADGALRLGGDGEPVEWLLEMERFDQADLLRARAALGPLPFADAEALAESLARLHATAPSCQSQGWRRSVQAILESNSTHLTAAIGHGIDQTTVDRIDAASADCVRRLWKVLEGRGQAGHVRQCHGDLHLDNIVYHHGRPVPFDCIEFNDAFACIDVLYDLAFVLMDLRFHDQRAFANRLLNAYLACLIQQEFEATLAALEVLPFYMAMRAAVRAHVSAQTLGCQIGRMETGAQEALRRRAEGYARFAAQLTEPSEPCLIAIGGLSGTGKSTLARGLAPLLGGAIGAVVIRSDEVRKRHFGVAMQDHLPDTAYAPRVHARVYEMLEEEARLVLDAGQPVILDAVFAQQGQRDAIDRFAARSAVPFMGLWLEADRGTMEGRIARRCKDASDATISVMERQLDYDLGRIDWHRVDAGGEPRDVLTAARKIVFPGG